MPGSLGAARLPVLCTKVPGPSPACAASARGRAPSGGGPAPSGSAASRISGSLGSTEYFPPDCQQKGSFYSVAPCIWNRTWERTGAESPGGRRGPLESGRCNGELERASACGAAGMGRNGSARRGRSCRRSSLCGRKWPVPPEPGVRQAHRMLRALRRRSRLLHLIGWL